MTARRAAGRYNDAAMAPVATPLPPVLTPPVPAVPPVRYPTAADWWDALGNVPLHRIVCDPMPGSATEADVLRHVDGDDKKLVELIDGTLVEKPMGFEESEIAIQIAFLLKGHVQPRRLGRIAGADGTVRLRPRRVRIPDVGFYAYASLPGGVMPSGPIPDVAPDLAVEVISISNTRREMAIKRADYFAAGTRLVWEVDPPARAVDVYTTADGPPVRLTDAETILGGPVLPDFASPVAELFDVG